MKIYSLCVSGSFQVKKAKGSPGPTKVYVPTNTVRSAPSGTQGQVSGSVPTASAIEPSVERKVLEEANDEEEGICLSNVKVVGYSS